MFKTIRKITDIFNRFNLIKGDLSRLLANFEEAYKDKVIDPQEAVTLLYSLIKLLKKAFPNI